MYTRKLAHTHIHVLQHMHMPLPHARIYMYVLPHTQYTQTIYIIYVCLRVGACLCVFMCARVCVCREDRDLEDEWCCGWLYASVNRRPTTSCYAF